MILSNIKRKLGGSLRVFEKYAIFHKNIYCPIKLKFKDTTLHKYQSCAFTILNKMEENFEQRLKNIGKPNKLKID